MEQMMSDCGLRPVEFNVIVDQDPVEEKTKGGLILIDQDKQKHQTTRGTIVAVSPHAFNYAEWVDGPPKVGDRVVFAQYGGTFIDGADDKKYRCLKDKDILAVLS
jgi:chaperonin GroES